MTPPYEPEVRIADALYYPEPYSLLSMSPSLRTGLAVMGSFATLSIVATTTLICLIGYRWTTWRSPYSSFSSSNQYVILVLNLLFADLQQSLAMAISFHWLRLGVILAPSSACFTQAWLLHSGDVGSGLSVLTIAAHTAATTWYDVKVSNRVFFLVIGIIWLFSYSMAGIGVLIHGKKYFVGAGAWCWVSVSYEADRLGSHYFWIFLSQFGTLLIYVTLAWSLYRKSRRSTPVPSPNADGRVGRRIEQIARLMLLFPLAYIVLTMPLSIGRMWSMAHHGRMYSDGVACFTGSMITLSGFVDAIIYACTRMRMLQNRRRSDSSSTANGRIHSEVDLTKPEVDQHSTVERVSTS